MDLVPLEVFNNIFKPKHYILLFDVSINFRLKVCNFLSNKPPDCDYIDLAIKLHSLNFLSWWKYKGFPIHFRYYPRYYLMRCFDTKTLLEWVFDNKELTSYDYHELYERAIVAKSIPMLNWIYSRDIFSPIATFSKDKCLVDSTWGNTELYQWLLDHDPIPNQK